MIFFKRDKNPLESLVDFVAQCEEASNSGLSKHLPVLRIEVLPIEIPVIFRLTEINVLGLSNVDGDDFINEYRKRGRTERMVLGVNEQLGIEGQIQALLRMAIHTVERSRTFSSQNIKDFDGLELTEIEKQSDVNADEYAKIIINSLGTKKMQDVLEELFKKIGSVIKFKLRTKFIQDDSVRKRRYQIYDTMYDRYDFIKKIIDNLVGSSTGRGFKFVSPVLESSSDPMLKHLYEFALRSQMQKTINHFNRDVFLYGDGFSRNQVMYDEILMTLIKPCKVTLAPESFLIESNGNVEVVPRKEIMHIYNMKWDNSGFGVSEIEPLVGNYLRIAHLERIHSLMEDRFRKTFILEQQIELNKLIQICRIKITDEEERMKSILIDPTESYVKRTTNLYIR